VNRWMEMVGVDADVERHLVMLEPSAESIVECEVAEEGAMPTGPGWGRAWT